MLLMIEKELEEVYVTQYIYMQKQIISIWKIMIKTKNHHIQYLDANSLYGCAISQKQPVDGFNGKKLC